MGSPCYTSIFYMCWSLIFRWKLEYVVIRGGPGNCSPGLLSPTFICMHIKWGSRRHQTKTFPVLQYFFLQKLLSRNCCASSKHVKKTWEDKEICTLK